MNAAGLLYYIFHDATVLINHSLHSFLVYTRQTQNFGWRTLQHDSGI